MTTRSHQRHEPSRGKESGEHKLAVAVLQTTLHDLRNEARRDRTGGPEVIEREVQEAVRAARAKATLRRR